MSSDRSASRPRRLEQPSLPPGKLRDLKDALYELYLAACPITLDQIHARIRHLAEVSNDNPAADPTALPKRDTIHQVISGLGVPANVHHVVAVAAALLHPPDHEPTDVEVRRHPQIERIRDLWAAAAAERPPGRLIRDISPTEVEIHTANHDGTPPGLPDLPPYIDRDHDQSLCIVVEQAISGRSGLVVLVSDSTSGKTRACYEALHHQLEGRGPSLADAGWRLWPPPPETDPRTMLDELPRVGARTVVWLNEAQRYLLDPPGPVRDQIARGLRTLLTDKSRGPVLLLGTLWPDYWRTLTLRPTPDEKDTHAAARILLDGHGIHVPATFAAVDLARARATGDRRLVDAANQAVDGSLTQYLAGVPDLMQRFTLAGAAERAVTEAAMDARRLGHGEWIPAALLYAAAAAYLSTPEQRVVRQNPRWCADALTELSRLGDGQSTVLDPHLDDTTLDPMNRRYRLDDYLDQHGRRTRSRLCPRQPFWDAVLHHTHTSDELVTLAEEACARFRLQIGARLLHQAAIIGEPGAPIHLEWHVDSDEAAAMEHVVRAAADAGSAGALVVLAQIREELGDHAEAGRLAIAAAHAGNPRALVERTFVGGMFGEDDEVEQLALDAADGGSPDALALLALFQGIDDDDDDDAESEPLAMAAADAGHPAALAMLALSRLDSGDHAEAERLYRAVKDADGNSEALGPQALFQEKSGNHVEAERLAFAATDAGDPHALVDLVRDRDLSGDHAGAERLAIAAAAGHSDALVSLAGTRDESGDHAGAERLAAAAADAGNPNALTHLAAARYISGDHAEAERLYRAAADIGDLYAQAQLALIREKTGDHTEAERLAVTAAASGSPSALADLARARDKSGDHDDAERLYRAAAGAGHPDALVNLVRTRERSGDYAGAERLAADAGNPDALADLARAREWSGDHAEAERLYRAAADAGDLYALAQLALIREEAGDHVEAERLALAAADAGYASAIVTLGRRRLPNMEHRLRVLEFGLTADGAVAVPWD